MHKNKSLEKARPHRYSIGGRVDKSYHLLQTYLFVSCRCIAQNLSEKHRVVRICF
jgi:hypothetical protein